MDEREKLAAAVGDKDLIEYFYLDMDVLAVARRLNSLKLEIVESQDEVPFNAQVKSYHAARDERGDPWIIKPVATDEEMVYHRACMLAYLFDHATGTFAAPTTALLIDGKKYRVTKVVKRSIQISSYNYLESPFIGILRSDLVNRWIYFDEDRNPNNYLVITNSKNEPFVVAIDYDKADMLSESMKITGMKEKFGWLRTEKTRFLTLLRPENFDGACICDFDDRLKAFAAIGESVALELARLAFSSWCPDPDGLAAKVAGNFIRRRAYVEEYFRCMFKSAAETKDVCHDSDYSAFGQSFLDMHNRKK
jgi:hypothetical protein